MVNVSLIMRIYDDFIFYQYKIVSLILRIYDDFIFDQ